jgi:tetratricopeptide (TPR) repeat protein
MLAAIVVLLLIAAVAIIGAATSGGGDGGTQTAQKTAQPKATATPEKTPEATPTPDATNAPGPAATADALAGGDPAKLNADGYRLFQAGRYGEAAPYFQKAVDTCGGSTAIDPCGYATYNLGAALNRAGHPDQAIPVLIQRLQRWPGDQPGTVYKELKDACKATGQKCSRGGGGDGGGNGNGSDNQGD